MVDDNSLCNKILSKVHDDSTRTKSISTTKSQQTSVDSTEVLVDLTQFAQSRSTPHETNTCEKMITWTFLILYVIHPRFLATQLSLQLVDPDQVTMRKWSHIDHFVTNTTHGLVFAGCKFFFPAGFASLTIEYTFTHCSFKLQTKGKNK